MKLDIVDPPRTFVAGRAETGLVRLTDCAHIELEADEQVTFKTESGAEYDVLRKEWGYFATPSLNGRLEQFGLRAGLVKSANGRYFVVLVERGHEPAFQNYVNQHEYSIICWMDSSDALERVDARLRE